jgi:hypothetical protein
MTTYVSSLYEAAPNRGGTANIARSPSVDHRGVPATELFSFTIPTGTVLATNDVIKLVPGLPAGTKVSRFAMTLPGYDGGTALTANLGWASVASGAGLVTGLTTASIRTGGTISVTDAQVLAQTACGGVATATTNLQAAGAQDELVIFVSAGAASAGTNGATNVLVELVYP